MTQILISAIRTARSNTSMLSFALAGAAILLGGCRPDSSTSSADSTPKLDYGTKVSFGRNGNSDSFKESGWSKTEEKFTWSEGTVAVLRMVTAPTNNTVALKMTIAALIKPPELPFQPVEVEVNDQKIAEWQVSNTADFVAAIPHDITKGGGLLTITIRTPKSSSPKALGLSADPRILGICCLNLELSEG